MTLGGKCTSSTAKHIYQFDINGNLIKEWESFASAADTLGISRSAIFFANRCKYCTLDSFWSTQKEIDISEFTKLKHRECYKYDSEGNFVAHFDTIADAAKDANTTMNHIKDAMDYGGIYHNYYYSDKLYDDKFTGFMRPLIHKQVLYIYDLDGNFVRELQPCDIKSFFNIKYYQSLNNAYLRDKIYKGYQISLEYVDRLPHKHNKTSNPKPVLCYTLDGYFVEEFPSIKQASLKYGNAVEKVVHGQLKQTNGCIFKYKVNDIV